MRKILILTIALTFCLSAKSQFTNVGVRAGLNISNINDYIVAKPKVGFHVGGIIDYSFNDFFYLQGGLFLSGKGCKVDYSTVDFHNIKNNYNSYYLEIPILPSLRIPVIENGNLLLNIGPAFNIGLFGKTKIDTIYSEQHIVPLYENSSIESNTFDSKTGFGRFDISAMMGVGFEWKNYSFNFNYDYGFIILNQDVTFKGTNGVVMFTFGYNFQLNKE